MWDTKRHTPTCKDYSNDPFYRPMNTISLLSIVLVAMPLAVSMAESGRDLLVIALRPVDSVGYVSCPAACVLSVKNASDKTLKVYTRVPDPPGFAIKDEAAGRFSTGGVVASRRFVPIKLGPKEQWSRTLYLNRYLPMDKAGKRTLSFIWNLMVADENSLFTVESKGSLDMEFKRLSEDGINKMLHAYEQQMHSEDPVQRIEAVEAITTCETPLAVPFLAKMVGMEEGAGHALSALEKHNTRASHEALVAALDVSSGLIVAQALDILATQKVVIPVEKLELLVRSPQADIRFASVQYIRQGKVSTPEILEVLRSASSDQNTNVAAAAKKALRALQNN